MCTAGLTRGAFSRYLSGTQRNNHEPVGQHVVDPGTARAARDTQLLRRRLVLDQRVLALCVLELVRFPRSALGRRAAKRLARVAVAPARQLGLEGGDLDAD